MATGGTTRWSSGQNERGDPHEWKQRPPGSDRRRQGLRAPDRDLSRREDPGEIFGQNVFTKAVMQKRLPKPVFKSLMATIEHSKPLDPTVADVVAVGHEGLGDGEGRHPLRPRLLSPDRT